MSAIVLGGPCIMCGALFETRDPLRQYCSIPCYLISPEYSVRLSRVMSGKVRSPFLCKQCGEPNFRPTHKHQQFCCPSCWRAWFAKRFDRYVANPIELDMDGHGFDEFLSRPALPCLVPGCGWKGASLSQHTNMMHGITAPELKARTGFNRKTGLVNPDLADRLSARGIAAYEAGYRIPPNSGSPRLNVGTRPEGIEHWLKGRTAPEPVRCRWCNQLIPGAVINQKYCNPRCRRAHRTKRQRIARYEACAECLDDI